MLCLLHRYMHAVRASLWRSPPPTPPKDLAPLQKQEHLHLQYHGFLISPQLLTTQLTADGSNSVWGVLLPLVQAWSLDRTQPFISL